MAPITINYIANRTVRTTPSLMIKAIVKNYAENILYGLGYTLPFWVNEFEITLPILVVNINGMSNNGIFGLNLKGKKAQ